MTLLSTKKIIKIDNIEDIASQSRVVFEAVYSMTEKTQFMGCMFPQVVQRHKLEEVRPQINIPQHTHSAISHPNITKIG